MISTKNKNYFLSVPECFRYFSFKSNSDLMIWMIGYHNFHYIKPELFIRQQNYHTLHFIISGTGFLEINGKQFIVKPYEIFYLDDKCKFSYYPSNDDPWEYVFFEFNGKLIRNYLEPLKFSYDNPLKTCQDPEKIIGIFKKIFSKSEYDHNLYNTDINYYDLLSILFSVLGSVYIEKEKSIITKTNIIDEIIYYIHAKCLNSNFTVESICRIIPISHSHLCRIFKQSMNISIASYIKNYRLEYAKKLLLTTDLSLETITFESGFNEYVYFLRSFKSKYGFTPSEYKQLYKENFLNE